ncbi:hypothetical protein Dda_8154 [Drechslerella dactyloides]|uniref:Uncharacterized protein n=1 Tax=Drechslerella dactyloides TaxID=74499 RepID=A0AAD6ITC4_DREDA|nr:hypothetical protein Dda_8154 [Drechslerella dactyloides]
MADGLVPLFTEEKAASKYTPPSAGATTTEPGCFIYVKSLADKLDGRKHGKASREGLKRIESGGH